MKKIVLRKMEIKIADCIKVKIYSLTAPTRSSRKKYSFLEKKSGIYILENIINKKVYIGSAYNLKSRWLRHFKQLSIGKHKNILLQNSYKKHGSASFVFNIIKFVKKEQLLDAEQKLIDQFFDNQISCYNICAKAGNWGGNKHNSKSRKLIGLNNPHRRPVEQWSLDGVYIKNFETMSAACRSLSADITTIFVACKKPNANRHGFQWKFVDDVKIIKKYISKNGGRKRVRQLDKNGNLIAEYNSLTEASCITKNSVTNISACVRGKTKTSGTFKWEYIR